MVVGEIAGALGFVLNPVVLGLILLATFYAFFVGVVPGLGGVVALALLIPITYGMDPNLAFVLLAAAMGGVTFGGSITSILLNAPGVSSNVPTLIDGYPMTRNGQAGQAIAASATSSAAGALLGLLVLVVSIPFLLEIVLVFGPPEIFWLGIWGITLVATLLKGGVLNGFISAGLGAILAFHGLNNLTATQRWTYDILWLYDGVQLVSLLIGLFAISEMITLVASNEQIARTDNPASITGGRTEGILSVVTHKWLFFRSAVIGTIVGLVPGVGGIVPPFIAYFQAKQTEPDADRFGAGDIRGVIAPESANDAKTGGALIPTLALGIPGSAGMAVLLGAFVLHGITPGPTLLTDHFDIVVLIILALIISNVATSLTGLVLLEKLVVITRINPAVVAALVIAVCLLGSYAIRNSVFDPVLAVVFGVLGYVMMKENISRVPLILAFVLVPIIERNFHVSLQISGGSYLVFWRDPVTLILFLLVIGSLLLPVVKHRLSHPYLAPEAG